MKTRINDLARELEVKSKAILDALEELGIAEKKTHSSSLEDDETAKIRKYFSAKSGPASKEKASHPETKPKIDLSRISKPGDVLKLLKEREQQQHPAAPAKSAAAAHAHPATPAGKPHAPATPLPTAEKPSVVAPKPAAMDKAVVVAPAAKPAAAVPAEPPAPVTEKRAGPPAVVVTPPAHAPAAVAPPKTPGPAAPAASTQAAPPKPASQQPIVPRRRMITPQTGPRPVYQAPPQEQPSAASPAGAQGQTGGPMQAGAGGRPQGVVRGQPIFQRPRPTGPGGAPSSRQPYVRPGEQRRGPHPTSTARSGFPPRPGMGRGMGWPPPGLPAQPAR